MLITPAHVSDVVQCACRGVDPDGACSSRVSNTTLRAQGEAAERMQSAVARQLEEFAAQRAPGGEAESGRDSPAVATASDRAGPLQMTNAQVELAQEIGGFMKASRAESEQVRLQVDA